MSLASVYPADLHTRHTLGGLSGRSHSVSSSLDDVRGAPMAMAASEHVLTIEELRLQLNSCFTCGVSWADSHVSLDCSECGGYSLQRPCPLCDGACNQLWKRDLTMSHASGKARWEGECLQRPAPLHQHNFQRSHQTSVTSTASPNPTASAAAALAHELCARLEKLQATS